MRRTTNAVRWLLTIMFAGFGVLSSAWAAESPWDRSALIDGTAPLEARLITAAQRFDGEGAIEAGIHVKLADGWKTYWRSPGSVGLPPTFDWALSSGIDDVSFDYPAPSRFTAFDIENIGYGDELVFPLWVTPKSGADRILLKVNAEFLVCAEICVPTQLSMNLLLAKGEPTIDERSAQLISRFQAQIPDDGARSGFVVNQVALAAARTGVQMIAVEIDAREPFEKPDIFLELGDNLPFGRPEITLVQADHRLRAVVELQSGKADIGSPIALTVRDQDRASTFKTMITAGGSTALSADRPLILMLAFALLGGLILNVMPCVLPVLSLKLAGVIGQRNSDPGTVRRRFLITASGIITAMLVIGLVTLGFKLAGSVVGWGVQFQDPSFLIFMIILLTLFAANLVGLFEIQLPSSLMGGLAKAGGHGHAGDFASGAFATLLATPCSAPFLGTAVGFALSGSSLDIVMIFTMLGLGLSLPYLVVAWRPGLIRLLPKPGAWMGVLRLVLSLALVGTAVWLIWVLSMVESDAAGLMLLILMTVLGFLLLVIRRINARRAKRAVASLGLLVIAAGFAAPHAAGIFAADTRGHEVLPSAVWQSFDAARIQALVDEGNTVFVDVTADWCITCKANKFLVLDTAEIAPLLMADDVVAMQADWTKPDPAIAHYLQSHGRYGIPFNIVYGPSTPDGQALPELLSISDVRDALIEARGGPG